MATKKSKGKRTITVDMEGVESGGQVIEEGLYTAVIHEIEEQESSKGNPMLVVKWKITSKKGKGALLWDNVSLTPQALWRFKGLLEAIEVEVPDSSFDVDLDDLIEKEARVQVSLEKFEGKDRPRITAYSSLEDKGEDDSDESGEKDEDDETEETDESEEDEKPAKVGTGIVKGARVKFKDDKGRTVKGTVTKIKGDNAIVSDEEEDDWEIPLSELSVAK